MQKEGNIRFFVDADRRPDIRCHFISLYFSTSSDLSSTHTSLSAHQPAEFEQTTVIVTTVTPSSTKAGDEYWT
jgi:hypothetical protein